MKSSEILDRLRDLLKATAPFNELPEDAYEKILLDLSIEYFQPGEVIITQGSTVAKGLYLVESGLVRLMDLEHQRLLGKCGEGDSFGSLTLIEGGATHYEARAVEPTVCALLKAERFKHLYETQPDFAAFFDSDIRRYIRRAGTTVDASGAYLLMGRRLDQLALRRPPSVPPETPAQAAAKLMNKHQTSTLLVRRTGLPLGVVTDSDLRTRLIAQGEPLETPVKQLMSTPVVTIRSDATLLDAMTRMLESGVRRLVVVPAEGQHEAAFAVLTDRDLVHYRGLDPVATIANIEHKTSTAELVDIRAEMNQHLLRLYQQGVPAEVLTRIAAAIYDCIVIKVLHLVEREAGSIISRPANLKWAWLRLGSSARREMALSSTQHNAIVYSDVLNAEEAQQAKLWFDVVAERTNEALETCGFTPSEVVARDPRWRKPLSEWKKTYRNWINAPDDEETMASARIFLDQRGVYGDPSLVQALQRDFEEALRDTEKTAARPFLVALAALALENRPALSFFRRFAIKRTGEHRNQFDIRERGILPVVDAARVLAVETRYAGSANTFDRLRHAAEALPDLSEVIMDALDAYGFLVDFRLAHQLLQVEAGDPPDNHIDPTQLTPAQQNLLRSVFTSVGALQKALSQRYTENGSG